MSKTHVVSIRMSIEDLAKARDALISKGIPLEEINTLSQIVKLTFYFGIIHICQAGAKSPASQSSISFVKQKFCQTKITKNLKIQDYEE